ncbi:MAG TPA: ParB/RepB/Spo0J family partition protein [Gemmatimonadaceae bacterium]|nr:ParB/RepB/Spo0J family partition protein [Gemmatimonadaceae bacterium]
MSSDRRLGRGLEALISASATTTATASELQRIPLSRVRPNPFQPRRDFDPDEMRELEASLKSSGLLQPISVRRLGDAFELIAGERRVRAASNLGWTEISALVRDFDDRTMLVLALVENLQRANLNPLEEARGYRRLIEEFHLTHQQVAEAVGKDRTTITNLLRILALPDAVQKMVEDGGLSTGHARALLGLADSALMSEVGEFAAEKGLSVRELEQLVRERTATGEKPAPKSKRESAPESMPVHAAARGIEDDLRRYLQTDVKVKLSGAAKGTIEVMFYSNDDLDRLLGLILRDEHHW